MLEKPKHVLAHKPYHILAKPENVAEKVLAVGDPGRATLISKLLEEPKLVNENRGYLVYTGKWKGERVTVATHGIGAPSAAIVFEELRMLGAKVIIRLGTTGGFRKEIEVGSIVVPVGALYEPGGTIGLYVKGTCFPAIADPEIVLKLEEAFKNEGFQVFKGIIASSDAFHGEESASVKWATIGALSVEMECATLFTLSWLRGFRSGASLLVIDNLATGEYLEYGKRRSELEKKAAIAALNALIKV